MNVMHYFIIKRIRVVGRIVLNLSILAVCSSFLAHPAFSEEPEVVDRIVAIVNDEIITLSEVNAIFQPQADRIRTLGYGSREERKQLFKLREEILKGLINQKLTEQEVKKKNLKITRAEVDNTIERFKEDRMLSDEDLTSYLAGQNMSEEEFRKNIENSILRGKLLSYEVRSKIVVTQEDIKAYYDSHPNENSPEKEYHLQNLAMNVSDKTDVAKKQDALQEMEKISKALNEGQTLQSVAGAYANSPYPVIGGDLGKFKLEELSPRLQEAIEGKKTGEYTSIMEADFGYQIIYIQEIRDLEGKSLEEASADIREKITNEKLDEKYREWMEKIRAKSHVKIIK